MAKRLAPLGQFAESAGGMFGLRLPGLSGDRQPSAASTSAPESEAGDDAVDEVAPAPRKKKAAATKEAAKKSAARSGSKKKASGKNAD